MERWLHPAFEARLRSHDWLGRRVLDVGTRYGNLALLLAELGAEVLGIDRDAAALAEARTSGAGTARVTFVAADAEAAEYMSLLPGLTDVTAHLCMSEGIVRRAAAALPIGGRFLFCAHHPDHHREIGRAATYGMEETQLERVLRDTGLVPEYLGTHMGAEEYVSWGALREALPRQVAHWEEEGLAEGLQKRFESGSRTLTRAHVVGDVVKA